MRSLYRLTSMAFFLAISVAGFAQFVSGTVVDAAGPMPGVVVKDKTTNAGTATDMDGKYSLKLTAGKHTIDFLMTGYKSVSKEVEVKDGGTVTLNITLQEDLKDLDELIVVGYGVQRKRDVTGAIAHIDGKKVTQFPTPSFEAALQGQSAGVQVSQGSGLAGSGSLVRVRGVASVSAGGDPLYVVDGIPITQDQFLGGNSGGMNTNPLATINPNDIASIDILKDAAATGIYGSRGANGVILITTKRGVKPGMKFEFSTRFGVGMAASKPNMMNTNEYLAIRQEAWENDGGTGYVWLPNLTTANSTAADREAAFLAAKKINTDWFNETTGIGLKQAYNFSASKNTAKDAFYAGISYDGNGSYLLGNAYNRASARLNFDHKFSENLRLSTGLSFAQGVNKRVEAAWSGGVGEAMSTALPYFPVYNNDGTYYFWNNGSSNPVNYRVNRPWEYVDTRVIANAALVYSPVKNLNLKVTGAYDWMNGNDYRFEPITLNQWMTDSYSKWGTTRVNNFNYNFTADYTKEIGEDHVFTGLIGLEEQQSIVYNRYLEYANATGLANKGGLSARVGEGQATLISSNPVFVESNPSIFESAFARINYNYKNKLFTQLVGRMDGSSKFGTNNKVGYFPSASVGYVLSEEKFLKDSKVISFLKLRMGYGFVGNSNIPQSAQYGDRTIGGFYYGQTSLFTSKLPNPNLQWEKATTFDVTAEIGFLKDRITTELSYYRKNTSQVLMELNIPGSTGFSTYWDNVGEIMNEGFEVSITSYNISTKNFEWKTELNASRNHNELVSIGNYTPDAVNGATNDTRSVVGQPIGSFYLVKWSHVDQATGRPVYLDKNGNETFTFDQNNRQFVGAGLPLAWGGFTNSFRYKNMDLSVFFTWSIGAKIWDQSGRSQLQFVHDWNMRTDALDRWRQPGDVATYPQATMNPNNNGLPQGFPYMNTDLFLFKADYIRLKNLNFGYNFPVKQGGTFSALRLGATISNLFVITNFVGLDPEVVRDFSNNADRNLSPNVTYLTPPQERSFNISLNASF